MRRLVAVLASALITTGQLGCTDVTTPIPSEIFVGIAPMAYFADRIGGGDVVVQVLVPDGRSPHTFEPTPRQMADLAGASIYLSAGLPFESRVLEKLTGIDTDLVVIDIRSADEPDESGHSPGVPGHTVHSHDLDPHVWLDPRIAMAIAGRMRDAMKALDPERGDAYDRNLDALVADLDELDSRVSAMLRPFEGEGFLVFHPAFGHFARAYGLRQLAVEIDGKEPSARQLAQLIDSVRATNIKTIFVQPQLSAKSAQTVADAIDGTVEKIDPLAYDYIANMESIAAALESALSRR